MVCHSLDSCSLAVASTLLDDRLRPRQQPSFSSQKKGEQANKSVILACTGLRVTVAHADGDYACEQIEVSLPVVIKQPLLVSLKREEEVELRPQPVSDATNLRDENWIGVIGDESRGQELLPDFERFSVRLSLREHKHDKPHITRSSVACIYFQTLYGSG